MHIRDTGGLLNYRRWWSSGQDSQAGELTTSGGMPDALIEEFNWPARSSRSVVAVILRDNTAAGQFPEAFAAAAQGFEISQNVTVLRGARFSSYAIGGATYRVGVSTLLEQLNRTLQQFPWIVAVVSFIFCFLMAILLQARLRRRARLRLQSTQ
jgi:cellulose synthase (UDP-forming)